MAVRHLQTKTNGSSKIVPVKTADVAFIAIAALVRLVVAMT